MYHGYKFAHVTRNDPFIYKKTCIIHTRGPAAVMSLMHAIYHKTSNGYKSFGIMYIKP